VLIDVGTRLVVGVKSVEDGEVKAIVEEEDGPAVELGTTTTTTVEVEVEVEVELSPCELEDDEGNGDATEAVDDAMAELEDTMGDDALD